MSTTHGTLWIFPENLYCEFITRFHSKYTTANNIDGLVILHFAFCPNMATTSIQSESYDGMRYLIYDMIRSH